MSFAVTRGNSSNAYDLSVRVTLDPARTQGGAVSGRYYKNLDGTGKPWAFQWDDPYVLNNAGTLYGEIGEKGEELTNEGCDACQLGIYAAIDVEAR
jgi:hypothetical protein